jgi:lipoprotein-releasing system permease protein
MFVIALVTAAMIIVLSAFNGLENLVSEIFGTLDAELALVPLSGEVVSDTLSSILDEHEGIAYYSKVIENEAIIRSNGKTLACSVLGVDARFNDVSRLDSAIVMGGWGASYSDKDCVCLGYGIKSELQIFIDTNNPEIVSLGAPIRGKKLSRNRERAFRTIPALACGAFSINSDLDTRYAITSLSFARELFDRTEHISRYEISPAEGYTAEDLMTDDLLIAALGDKVKLRSRAEKNKFITQTNKAEKWATFVILSFILVVAAFNILASLTMLLIDKKSDIEVFKAMGMTNRDLERTFSIQGLAINIVGGFVGLALGVLLVLGQTRYGWIELSGSVVPAYPVKLVMTDVIGILAIVIGIGGIGSAAMVKYLIRKIVIRE